MRYLRAVCRSGSRWRAGSRRKHVVTKFAAGLGLSLVVIVGALLGGSRVARAVGPTQGTIAFSITTARTGDADIYSMNADGTGVTDLTNDVNSNDFWPSYSPDGSKIAFQRNLADGNRDIFVINADGSGLRRLTTSKAADRFPVWTPDGSHVVFASNRNDPNFAKCTSPNYCNFDVFEMNADGTNVRQLTSGFDDFVPSVSPAGTIAFMSYRSGVSTVWTMAADGSQLQQLSPDSLEAGFPRWSPDGTRLAFENNACPTCAESDIFLMNAQGKGIVQVTHDFQNNLDPAWSPDGKQLTFDHNIGTANTQGPADIYRVNLNGTGLTQLTRDPADDDCCSTWRP